jgi:hypothetical protein
MSKQLTIPLRVEKVCKHSVRFAPTDSDQSKYLTAIYIPNKALDHLEYAPGVSISITLTTVPKPTAD